MRFPAAFVAISLLSAFLSATRASTQHEPESTAVSVGKEQRVIYHSGCSANQSQVIKEAVDYAFDVVQFVTQVRDNPFKAFGQLDPISAAFNESKYFGVFLSEENKEYITNVFRTLTPSSIWTNVTYVCVHSCSMLGLPDGFGVAYTSPDKIPMVVFVCPVFLDSAGLKKTSQLPQDATCSLDNRSWPGLYILHEMMHLTHLLPQQNHGQAIKEIIDEPVWADHDGSGSLAYGEFLSRALALLDPGRALTNADNYALYALRVFVIGKSSQPEIEVAGMLHDLWSWTRRWFHGEL